MRPSLSYHDRIINIPIEPIHGTSLEQSLYAAGQREMRLEAARIAREADEEIGKATPYTTVLEICRLRLALALWMDKASANGTPLPEDLFAWMQGHTWEGPPPTAVEMARLALGMEGEKE